MGFDGVEPAPDAPTVVPIVGELDATFGTAGVALLDRGTTGTGYGLLPRATGGVVVVGVIEVSPGVHAAELTAWTASGATDASYGTAGRIQLSLAMSTWAYGARRLADGRALIWGDGVQTDTQDDDLMYALLGADDVPTGPLRNIDVQVGDTAHSVVERPGGGHVLCGVANREDTNTHYALAFTTATGDLDAAIGSNGVRYDDDSPGEYNRCWDMDADGQGRLVTAGSTDNDLTITRHLADGSRDPTFGGTGRVRIAADQGEGYAMAFAPDGDILVVGVDGSYGVVARFDPSGQLRTSFGAGGIVRYLAAEYETFLDVLVDSDGKVLVGGLHGRQDDTDGLLLRFGVDGTLDPTFGDAGVILIDRSADDVIHAIARGTDGIFATGDTNGTTWLIKVR